ncbi:MAG TPA: hypothetical protein VE173_06025, partial [Longimicrobiales bacterium]|nr:hypothetical protein [Longimicrobiales bacterium]
MPFTNRIPSQYTPPTGFGGFSVTLDPNGTLDVQVRVHWDFQAGDGGVAWTPGDQGLFKNTFKQNIPTTWNR